MGVQQRLWQDRRAEDRAHGVAVSSANDHRASRQDDTYADCELRHCREMDLLALHGQGLHKVSVPHQNSVAVLQYFCDGYLKWFNAVPVYFASECMSGRSCIPR